MPHSRILILAGTGEARELANALHAKGVDVVTSFAGVTKDPLLPAGEIHVGGFGGTSGLLDFLASSQITSVIDATHPFAAQMSRQAHEACQHLQLSLMRLERSAWSPQDGDNWHQVQSAQEAAELLPGGARVFLTTGHKWLDVFLNRADLSGVVRTIEPPRTALPPHWTLLLDRPPHRLEDEMQLLTKEKITHLVSKNAGGAATAAKLEAARRTGCAVVMIARPSKPQCITVATVDEALLGIMGKPG